MSNSTEAKYFDLHTTGIGYLNRIREVTPKGKKSIPFMAVTIAALKGKSDDVEYQYIDCNVVGAEAEMLIRRCKEAVDNEKKVLVSFRIGDVWPDIFTYTKGDKAGQSGVSLKGRLLFISWIKVDGVTVYEAKPREEAPASIVGESQPVPPADAEPVNESAAVADPDPEPVDASAKAKRAARRQAA
jgi:hypothetical protein